MNPIPTYDAEATATLRDIDGQRLLHHLRNQRPDGAAPGEQIEPPRDEPLASAPAPGPSVMVFDRASILKQLRLVGPGDEIGESGPSSSASNDEQGRVERLRALVHENPLRRLVVTDGGTSERLGRLREECPGFVDVIALVERAAALSMIGGTGIALPPLLLVGPPGLGKTHFSRRLAAALGVEQHAFSCATNSDAQALLIGHPPTWRGARMGVVTEAILGGDIGNPLIVLDEIDKFVTHSAEKPYNSLLALLEPENACALVDEYLRVPFDLSRCMILATANDGDLLPSFIQDRFLIVTIAPPDGAMLHAIARRIAADLIAAHGEAFALAEDAVVARLARTNPRGIRRLVALALGFAAQAGRLHLIVDDVAAAEAVADTKGARNPIGFISPKRET